MWKKLLFVLVVFGFVMPQLSAGQDAKTVLAGVAKTMGATDVKSLQYTGSGTTFAVGQSAAPGEPWPRFNAKSFTRTINYDTVSMRDDIIRTQAAPTPRGGGGQPVIGEQRQLQMVSGSHAWNQVGENFNPALAAVDDRLHQLWITPHGVIKAAMAHNATAQTHCYLLCGAWEAQGQRACQRGQPGREGGILGHQSRPRRRADGDHLRRL
jgi:hypothetical protein